MNEARVPLDWNDLEALTDAQLSALVDSALFVLGLSAESDAALPADMPAGPLARALENQGLDAETASRLARDDALSRPVAIAVLRQLAAEPALAEAVERAWRERSGLLVVDAGVILGAALLLLVLKLRKVKVHPKEGVEVELDNVSATALGSVFKFLGG